MAKKLFGGKETYGEEMKEAKALKSGKISEKEYAKGEMSEGEGKGMKKGGKVKMASGGLSPRVLARMVNEGPQPATMRKPVGAKMVAGLPPGPGAGVPGMKKGGKVKKMAVGGAVSGPAGKDKETSGKKMGMMGMKKGGKVSKHAKGGYVTSADGVAQRGKTSCKSC